MASLHRSILVKAAFSPSNDHFALDGKSFTTRPLFRSIGASRDSGINAAEARWHIVSSPDMEDAHLWDICHALLSNDLGLSSSIAFAEPNLTQQWIFGEPRDQASLAAASCTAHPQNFAYPTDANLRWYTDAKHANFASATGAGVRIAHLDTGYDPQHKSVPRNLELYHARNYVDAAQPDDATDRTPSGMLSAIGHGTGTLSILAGAEIQGDGVQSPGAASDAFVVPIRVANSVVLFENSAIAQALDYVHELCLGGVFVDVVTMSMGGLASQAWAEAVSALYDCGVFIVTAAGNNCGNLPTHNIVYPARFRRVVAACGIMANGRAYADLDIALMAGNYGPNSKMGTAMAAYTPNVPWAQINCPTILNFDGNGTSCATPQIAAAAARWIEKHRLELKRYAEPWMRVESIRSALFGSARELDRLHSGNGALDSATSLDLPAPDAADLKPQPIDVASFPLLRLLTGLGLQRKAPKVTQAMLELEALQLSQSAAIEALLPDPDDAADLSPIVSRGVVYEEAAIGA